LREVEIIPRYTVSLTPKVEVNQAAN
jgi:hypothetical protein